MSKNEPHYDHTTWVREHRTLHCAECDETVDTDPVTLNEDLETETRRCESGHEFTADARFWVPLSENTANDVLHR